MREFHENDKRVNDGLELGSRQSSVTSQNGIVNIYHYFFNEVTGLLIHQVKSHNLGGVTRHGIVFNEHLSFTLKNMKCKPLIYIIGSQPHHLKSAAF